MKKQREKEKNHLAQQFKRILSNTCFCYDRKSPINNDNEKKLHFLQHKEKYKDTKETYTDRLKSKRKKVDFAAVFTDITRRQTLSVKSPFNHPK